ncbi:sodium-coupled monocarboxylate transporter 1-like [Littorina saxatilis]|uniref:Sodium-coupled monocarboxylate transporter 2 n=1 Tax=Littorina saxatilis TaxID=31220 RepID=A0AAN9BXC8_9CAEN
MSSGEDYSINTGVIRRFGTVDYVLFVLTLLVSAGIGIFYAIWDRKRNTTNDFLLGGKNMSVFPVAMSLCVTFMSALTLLGNPAEIYNYNTMFWYLVVAFIFGVSAAAFLFIPFFYELQITSTFEYLEMRFSKPVRILGSCLLVLQMLLYMAFLLYAPSLALNAVTGLNLWGSVVGMGVVVTFYTTLGGMKAVLWTDTFQAGVIFAGLLAVVIQGSIVQGGFGNAWAIADNRSRIVFDDFSFDPKTRHSAWSMVVGGMCFWAYLYGINQAQVQRCLSCPSVKKARMALFVNLPGLIVIVCLACMIGVVMFAFYADCHPIKFGLISKTDQLVPLFVMDILGHLDGLPGIFVSCVVSGSLSSLSSGLNALSAVTFRDWIQGCNCCVNISEFRSTIVNKLLVAGYGVLAIGLAWVVSQLGAVLQAVYVVFGVLNGPVLGVMTLGMFFPWANKWGAFTGTLASLVFLLWVGMGAFVNEIKTPVTYTVTTACNWTARPTPAPPTTTPSLFNTTVAEGDDTQGMLEPLYRMSYMWYTGLGMVIVWGVGLIVSAITGFIKPTTVDPRLILPVFDKLFPYLPEKVLKPLRFGIVHEGKYNLPPSKSVNLSVHAGSNSSVGSGNSVNEKQPYDVTNGHVKPKFELGDDASSKDVKIEMQNGQMNKAYENDDVEKNGVLKTRL